jgi:transposase-like protein
MPKAERGQALILPKGDRKDAVLRGIARWVDGAAVNRAAREEGIHESVLRRWIRRNPYLETIRFDAATEVRDLCAELIYPAAEQLGEALEAGSISKQSLPIVLGILSDKIIAADKAIRARSAPLEQGDKQRTPLERLLDLAEGAVASGGSVSIQGATPEASVIDVGPVIEGQDGLGSGERLVPSPQGEPTQIPHNPSKESLNPTSLLESALDELEHPTSGTDAPK